ncbi:hypothetical protein P7K49_021629 [Saguinus oedipus]|uniref:Galectin domain-containing protein n=1 Tax=Saguinus oedipus TaxID=9490 RepID=A0ABQ9UTY1_SAGOE|nr:hypothetical protein P7K49_021629 [Saguinus oedipus]
MPAPVLPWPPGAGGPPQPSVSPFLNTSLVLQEVPCSHALPQGLWPEQVIIVRGLVLQEPKQKGAPGKVQVQAEAQNKDVASHGNARCGSEDTARLPQRGGLLFGSQDLEGHIEYDGPVKTFLYTSSAETHQHEDLAQHLVPSEAATDAAAAAALFFTLSLRDQAAHAPVTLRASFTDRTLAWISPWGQKKLISAPFLFYPQRFFEVLLLCQEGGLKLALNGQGLGATSVNQQALEQLRELRISGSVQLYCVHS